MRLGAGLLSSYSYAPSLAHLTLNWPMQLQIQEQSLAEGLGQQMKRHPSLTTVKCVDGSNVMRWMYEVRTKAGRHWVVETTRINEMCTALPHVDTS